jgi:hypothetical protein
VFPCSWCCPRTEGFVIGTSFFTVLTRLLHLCNTQHRQLFAFACRWWFVLVDKICRISQKYSSLGQVSQKRWFMDLRLIWVCSTIKNFSVVILSLFFFFPRGTGPTPRYRAYTLSHSTSLSFLRFFFFPDTFSQTICPGWVFNAIVLICLLNR